MVINSAWIDMESDTKSISSARLHRGRPIHVTGKIKRQKPRSVMSPSLPLPLSGSIIRTSPIEQFASLT